MFTQQHTKLGYCYSNDKYYKDQKKINKPASHQDHSDLALALTAPFFATTKETEYNQITRENNYHSLLCFTPKRIQKCRILVANLIL